MSEKTKQIKLQPKYRSLARGERKIVPELKVSGIWLEAAGFKAGEKVIIIISDRQLIIKTIR